MSKQLKIIDQKINEIQPTVSIPGFRKGKAPISIVRKKYEDNVISEAIERLVQDKTKNLLDEKNLKLAPKAPPVATQKILIKMID